MPLVHGFSHGLCQCRTKSSRACSRVGKRDCVCWTREGGPSITCHCLLSSCKIHSLRLCGSSIAILSASSKRIRQRSLTEGSGMSHSPRLNCPILDMLPSLRLAHVCFGVFPDTVIPTHFDTCQALFLGGVHLSHRSKRPIYSGGLRATVTYLTSGQ